MGYPVPTANDPRREMFDMMDLVDILSGDRIPLDLQTALRSAKRTFFGGNRHILKLNYIVLRADDQLELISVGRRGGWKTLWKFGPYQMPAKFRGGVAPIPAQTIQTIMKGGHAL
jgi:hypothetical protein